MTKTILDDNILNHPDIWRRVAHSVIYEICGGQLTYAPVPLLKDNGQECLPLQVFSDCKSLFSGSVLKLGPLQTQLTPRNVSDRKVTSFFSWIRRAFKQEKRPISSEKVPLCEETSKLSGPDCFEFMQSVTCSKPSTTTDKPHKGFGRQTTFRLRIYDVHIQKIDPRKLLACRINPESPVGKTKKRRFYLIYETYVAERVSMRLGWASRVAKPGQFTESVLLNCPVCFRFVEVQLDGRGVVANLRFDVTRDELQEPEHSSIIPTMSVLFERATQWAVSEGLLLDQNEA